MGKYATLETKEGVGIITFSNPPVNALSSYAVAELVPCFEEAINDDAIQAIVLIGGNNTFIGGADINEFGKTSDQITDIFKILDEFDGKPIVAAIEKYALGGGLEVALCCHFRIAAISAKVGLPEVFLGLLPGGRGTQKLPRLVGVENALEFMMTGKNIPANQAKTLGLVDAISEGNLLEDALAFTKTILKTKPELKKPLSLSCEPKPDAIKAARHIASMRMRGFLAPQAIINCVEAASTKSVEEGLKVERDEFIKLVTSKECFAQIYAFFSEKQSSKIPFLSKDMLPISIKSAAVYGLGNMGNGIAMNFATAGIPVRVFEKDKESLDKGYARIKENYESTHKKGRLSKEKMDRSLSLITPCEDISELKEIDVLIEAIFEDMDLKKKLFTQFCKHSNENTLLISNTSALNIDTIASATKRPDKVCGMHFFNPANKMKVLEVVKGKASSGPTLKTVMSLAKSMKKTPVLVGNCPGFVNNRIFAHFFSQAATLIFQGAPITQVDKAIWDFGFPMGPFVLNDLTGINLSWLMAQAEAKKKPSSKETPYYQLIERLIKEERLGQRTAKGYYTYNLPDRSPIADPLVQDWVTDLAQSYQIKQQTFSDEDIVKRCLYNVINEACKCLDEGMALRGSDIDILALYGYAFPAYRGGIMYYADQIGLSSVLDDIKAFQAQLGDIWKPSAFLEKAVKDNLSLCQTVVQMT